MISYSLTPIDWLVIAFYLGFTTWLGAKFAGKQSTIREYFLAGRKLPWYAVSCSIIATEISAITFVAVPFVVFNTGGNYTYLQLGLIGTILARVIVGYWLVPAYYKKEIYSPYDYMENQLGSGVRSMTTVLFTIGGMLAQSARVYLTAEVLVVVMHDQLSALGQATGVSPLGWAILLIGVISVVWTLMGGMSTVVWTDVMLFFAFVMGAIVAIGMIAYQLDGGLLQIVRMGWSAKESGSWGKFTFFDFSISPNKAYTLWAAAIASTWGGVGSYGTCQLMAQRMFCCKNERDARFAIIGSSVSIVVTALLMFVGVGLYAFYETHSLSDVGQTLYLQKPDRIFPIFIIEAVIPGFKGFIIAGIFAAAISSFMGILTALSQTVMTAFFPPTTDQKSVFLGRMLVIFWGVVLCAMAYVAEAASAFYPSILDLALAMAGYTTGALLAGFFLAFLPVNVDGKGFLWSAPLSVLTVFATVWHQEWSHTVCLLGALILIAAWCLHHIKVEAKSKEQTLIFLIGIALMFWLNIYGFWIVDGKTQILAFPWYIPLGSLTAFTFGYLLGEQKMPVYSTLLK